MKYSTLLALSGVGLCAAEFSVQVVDGLGRPIPDAKVEVTCWSKSNKDKDPLYLKSDGDGSVHGRCGRSSEPYWVNLEAKGYQPHGSVFRSRYALRRELTPDQVRRIAQLDEDSQERELREFLGGPLLRQQEEIRDLVFYYEARLRPALRALLSDAAATERAGNLLSMIGAPGDLHLIVQLSSPPAASWVFRERWRSVAAASMVNPDNEDEWSFLRGCADGEFENLWVASNAIQTLKLTASPHSLQVLEEAQEKNPRAAVRIAHAISYIRSNPPPLANADLGVAAQRVAQALWSASWNGSVEPRFNEAGDKAMVDFRHQVGGEYYLYTGTFHKLDGIWTLRGIVEVSVACSLTPGIVKRRRRIIRSAINTLRSPFRALSRL